MKQDKRTGIWTYSNASPEEIKLALLGRGLSYEESSTSEGPVHIFKKNSTAPSWKGIQIETNIEEPDPTDDTFCEKFLQGNYGIKKVNSIMRTYNLLVRYPEEFISDYRVIIKSLISLGINFASFVEGGGFLEELIGSHINGKITIDPKDRNGLVALFQ